MTKNNFGLSGKPRVRIYHINKDTKFKKNRLNSLAWQYVLVGVFVVGIIAGVGVVASDKLTQADQLADSKAQVAGTTTTEQWSMPIDFSTADLDVVADMLPVLIEESRHEPTAEEIKNAERGEALRNYFTKRKSPFAKDDATIDAFLNSNNMKLMIAISFVESTMGQKCYYHNCSGIGGTPPRLRKYDSYADWIKDFDALLEKRYKGLPIEKFLGLYVQPGSPNWLNGVKQILAELQKQGIE